MVSEKPLKFALVAGEASGDTLGASLIDSLKALYPNASFIGIGGKKMQAAGLESWFDMNQLSVMGFAEVLANLPALLKLRKQLIQQLLQYQPDVFIGIDAPDFNFTVEKNLKANGIKTVHYVGPSVWAWREGRLNKIKHYVDGVLTLFPFEKSIYDKYQIPSQFVGHPLAKKIPIESKSELREQFNLSSEQLITAILPGSRMSEVSKMLPIYLQVAKLSLIDFPEMKFVIPAANLRLKSFIESEITNNNLENQVFVYEGFSSEILKLSDQAIVTSGTATLEAALNGCPHILAIKVHPISYWIMKRLAKTQWIGLPNVLAQKTIVNEYIQNEATAENMLKGLQELITSPSTTEMQLSNFAQQFQALNVDSGKIAAETIVSWAELDSNK